MSNNYYTVKRLSKRFNDAMKNGDIKTASEINDQINKILGIANK